MNDDSDFDGAGNGPILKVGEEKEIGHGLKKKLVREGEGSDTPEVGDEVQVHYTGSLVDGTRFYSSRDRGIPFKFVVGEDDGISGINRSLLTMKKGEVASFTIPPNYGFVSNQTQHELAPIPPNSTLRYEVELLSLVKEKKPCDMNTEERIEAAGKKKAEGNDLFNAGQYARASKIYEKALKFIEYDTAFGEEEKKSAKALKATCSLNDAACKLKLEEYKQAEKLCTKVLGLDSRNLKALFRRAQAYIQLAQFDLAEVDIKKALEIDPNNRDVKLEYKKLKEKVKETNKEDAEFYGKMFSKRKELDSLDIIIGTTDKVINKLCARSRLRFPEWRRLQLKPPPIQTSPSELVHNIVPLLLLKLEKTLLSKLLPHLEGFLLEELRSSLPSQLVTTLETTLIPDLVEKLVTNLPCELLPLLLDSLEPKVGELLSSLLPSLRSTLAPQIPPFQNSAPPPTSTRSPIQSADNNVTDKNSEELKEISLVSSLSDLSLMLFGSLIPFIVFVHDKATDVKSDPTLYFTVLTMAFIVHTGYVLSFNGLLSRSSATQTLLGRCLGILAINGSMSIGASVLISKFAEVYSYLYIGAFCVEWIACFSHLFYQMR